jgi:hypothetical protein
MYQVIGSRFPRFSRAPLVGLCLILCASVSEPAWGFVKSEIYDRNDAQRASLVTSIVHQVPPVLGEKEPHASLMRRRCEGQFILNNNIDVCTKMGKMAISSASSVGLIRSVNIIHNQNKNKFPGYFVTGKQRNHTAVRISTHLFGQILQASCPGKISPCRSNLMSIFDIQSRSGPAVFDRDFEVYVGPHIFLPLYWASNLVLDRKPGALTSDHGLGSNFDLPLASDSRALSRQRRFCGGHNRFFRIPALFEANNDEAKRDEGEDGRGEKQQLRIPDEATSEGNNLLIDRDLLLILSVFAGEIVFGLFGWNYLYDNRRLLDAACLLCGALLACLGGWWL